MREGLDAVREKGKQRRARFGPEGKGGDILPGENCDVGKKKTAEMSGPLLEKELSKRGAGKSGTASREIEE